MDAGVGDAAFEYNGSDQQRGMVFQIIASSRFMLSAARRVEQGAEENEQAALQPLRAVWYPMQKVSQGQPPPRCTATIRTIHATFLALMPAAHSQSHGHPSIGYDTTLMLFKKRNIR